MNPWPNTLTPWGVQTLSLMLDVLLQFTQVQLFADNMRSQTPSARARCKIVFCLHFSWTYAEIIPHVRCVHACRILGMDLHTPMHTSHEINNNTALYVQDSLKRQQNKMYTWSEKLLDSQHTSCRVYKMLSPVMFKLLKTNSWSHWVKDIRRFQH